MVHNDTPCGRSRGRVGGPDPPVIPEVQLIVLSSESSFATGLKYTLLRVWCPPLKNPWSAPALSPFPAVFKVDVYLVQSLAHTKVKTIVRLEWRSFILKLKPPGLSLLQPQLLTLITTYFSVLQTLSRAGRVQSACWNTFNGKLGHALSNFSGTKMLMKHLPLFVTLLYSLDFRLFDGLNWL